MTTVISFASQKGGVGKTTSAINLSTAFAVGGYRVLMIDLDPQDSVSASFGIKTASSYGTRELYCDPSTPLDELCTKTRHENLDFIMSNISLMADEYEVIQVAADLFYLKQWLQSEVEGKYDFVIIDCPPSMGSLTVNALVASDLVIIPLQCEALAMQSLKRFLRTFKELQTKIDSHLRIAGILLTMYDRQIEVHRVISQQVYHYLQGSVFQTIIPRCGEIIESSAVGKSVINKSISSVGSTAYIRLANEILDRFNIR
ncbi:MAG: ParA family protein [SAR324 cluster bacterium]|nr:ParA family protein [SAR324 cluster bacterium]